MKVHAIVADLDTARQAVAAGATVVQLRVKAPTAEVVARGRGFGELGATFVVNDDVAAAIELGADGVHLGQGDEGAEARAQRGSCSAARSRRSSRRSPPTRTTSAPAPCGTTPSKDDADPAIGLDGLREICAAVALPVVAIGGIDASNAGDCIRAGAAGVAVIRAATDPGLEEGR